MTAGTGKSKDAPELTTLAALAGEWAEAAAATSAIGLGILQAEIETLADLLPTAEPAPLSEEAARKQEAETEAGFDNLPV